MDGEGGKPEPGRGEMGEKRGVGNGGGARESRGGVGKAAAGIETLEGAVGPCGRRRRPFLPLPPGRRGIRARRKEEEKESNKKGASQTAGSCRLPRRWA